MADELEKRLKELASAGSVRCGLTTGEKNSILLELADGILQGADGIKNANAMDLGKLTADTPSAFRDRLTLNDRRIEGMVDSLRQVAEQPDPVNESVEERVLPNGLKLRKVRAPLGVVFLIFEARPNVITEAFSLAFKSGNGIVLRGGSESAESSRAIYRIIDEVLAKHGLGSKVCVGIRDFDRAIVDSLLKRSDLIDVVIPRGGEKLIEHIQRTALMPLIKNDRGMCHAYVEEDADLAMAREIVVNAKMQRPGVCNALETLLVHAKIADRFLPMLYAATQARGLVWKCDPRALKVLAGVPNVSPADSLSWDTEYLDLIMNCRLVDSLEEALEHIRRYGSKHSETIVTSSEEKARVFQREVDAAAVYWNASTRFTDGGAFGLGGEIGISTQKLHVRGPVGLRELTTPRWIVDGTGQVRT